AAAARHSTHAAAVAGRGQTPAPRVRTRSHGSLPLAKVLAPPEHAAMGSLRVVRRSMLAVLAALAAGCGSTSLWPPEAGAPAQAAPDDQPGADPSALPDAAANHRDPEPLLPASTVWLPCGNVGRTDSPFALAAAPGGRYLTAAGYSAVVWDLSDG